MKAYVLKKVFLVSTIVTFLLQIGVSRQYVWEIFQRMKNVRDNYTTPYSDVQRKYLILYHNPPPFLRVYRKYALTCNFRKCEWNNCELTFDKKYANRSDAIIYDGFRLPYKLSFTRPVGQVWIFTTMESPFMYDLKKKWWYKSNYTFNWTMTYDKDNTDIYLPYGEIRLRREQIRRNYEALVNKKNITPIMIASHCKTHSKRQEYVEELQKHINVVVLGLCGGNKWECGNRYLHDEFCFKMINRTYLLYLAFENAFCHNYFTEKFFENFNYDTIMVTRGGLSGDAKRLFPEGTFISTEDFKTVKDLATYLKSLTASDYAQMLKKKDQYFSTGYKPVYQRALCDICHRMNFQRRYIKTIKDMKKWAFGSKPCHNIITNKIVL